MIGVQNSHIRAPPNAALFHHFGHCVKKPHKTDGAGRGASGCLDKISFGPKFGKIVTQASSRLKNDGRVFEGAHYGFNGIVNIQRETSRTHPQITAEVGYGGRVGHKTPGNH